jgi:hypothetical protein
MFEEGEVLKTLLKDFLRGKGYSQLLHSLLLTSGIDEEATLLERLDVPKVCEHRL